MVFLIAIGIVALYLWRYFFPNVDIDKHLDVTLIPAVIAGSAGLISLAAYFWTPPKLIFPSLLAVHLLLAVSTGLMIIDTGTAGSPFVALWIPIGILSTALGVLGWLPLLMAGATLIAAQYINHELNTTSLIIISTATLLPLLASAVIFRDNSSHDADKDKDNYHNLASELNEVATKSEVVINAIGDGVIAIDSQGIIQLINPAAQALLGWGKQDAMALNYKSVLKLVNQKDEALDPTSDPIQQTLNSNQEVRTSDLTVMTNSGKKMALSLVVSPVGDIGSGVIVVFRDITLEKAAGREQAEFISTASHEMRTPVASIEGYLGLSLNPQTAQIDDRARDFIMKAQASTQHLGRLFQDLLDVAKSEDGRMSNNPRVVNVVELVHDITQGLKPKAIEKGLQLTYKPIPDDTNIRVVAPSYSVNLDNDHIREIVNNLVENAIKYTKAGEIVVDVDGDDDHVILSVKDSGIGIPKEDMPHLFQKFYRVNSKDTNDIGGTGLGLYLCRRLAEIMGGRIWVESVYTEGSTFFLELPRISNQDASRLAEEQSAENARQVAELKAKQQIIAQPTPTPALGSQPIVPPQPPVRQVIEPVLNTVPRGQALTPEQIAAYVAKQRALAQQQTAIANAIGSGSNRPQTITVPERVVQ